MRQIFTRLCLALLLAPCAALSGCGGSDAGPSLLVQKNVNGLYTLTATGDATDPPLFTANLSSGDPVGNSGANYYSVVTGTITNGVGMDLNDCNGQTIPISGKITNPASLEVDINMTGTTSDGGTLKLSGQMTTAHALGDAFAGTIEIDGGSCAMSSTAFTATH